MQTYTNPSFPGAFSGLENFYRNLKTPNISKLSVKQSLPETYSLHFPSRKKFKRSKFIVKGIDDTWQADLVDMHSYATRNKNFKFILTVIDVFSKYAWAIPIKNKTGKEVTQAFEKIFLERLPRKIHADKGLEFHNSIFKNLLKKHNIELYSTNSEMKAAIVERFNRTLKEKMWRMFTHSRKFKFIEHLADLVDNYNNSYHRSIKTKPILVSKANEYDVWLNLYGCISDSPINIQFKEGDLVRVSLKKNQFEKGYTRNWSKEVFKIAKVLPQDPPKYILEDLNQTEIVGKFYNQELQKI